MFGDGLVFFLQRKGSERPTKGGVVSEPFQVRGHRPPLRHEGRGPSLCWVMNWGCDSSLPAAAEGFGKQDGGDGALAVDLGQTELGGQHGAICFHDFEVAGEPFVVAHTG